MWCMYTAICARRGKRRRALRWSTKDLGSLLRLLAHLFPPSKAVTGSLVGERRRRLTGSEGVGEKVKEDEGSGGVGGVSVEADAATLGGREREETGFARSCLSTSVLPFSSSLIHLLPRYSRETEEKGEEAC